jgi:hypothetical protein
LFLNSTPRPTLATSTTSAMKRIWPSTRRFMISRLPWRIWLIEMTR